MNAGQTVTMVEIEVFRVTFPGGVRTENSIGLGNTSAPPAIPAMGNFSFTKAIGVGGTYCVRGTLTYTSGGMSFQIPIVSADQAL